jgi:hypothetical protein
MKVMSRVELMSMKRTEARSVKSIIYTYVLKPNAVNKLKKEEDKPPFSLVSVLGYLFLGLLIITPICSSLVKHDLKVKADSRVMIEEVQLPIMDTVSNE